MTGAATEIDSITSKFKESNRASRFVRITQLPEIIDLSNTIFVLYLRLLEDTGEEFME